MRKLAHIEKITSIEPIEGADSIELAKVLGWQCVVKKGEFKVGDLAIYVEIDSVMPDGLSDQDKNLLKNNEKVLKDLISKKEDWTEEDTKLKEAYISNIDAIKSRNTLPQYEFLRSRGFRIKTIKLRGTLSQGLLLPLDTINKTLKVYEPVHLGYKEGDDVTDLLGITKYEPEEKTTNISSIKHWTKRYKATEWLWRYKWFRRFILPNKDSDWPSHVSKTDEERIQNLPGLLRNNQEETVYITEKVDYQSVTFTTVPVKNKLFPFIKKNKFIVCSRNLVNNDKNSLYWKIAKKYNLEAICKANPGLIIQGEQGDTKVQGNKYKIKEPMLWVFNIIDKGYHYSYVEMNLFCTKNKLQPVPFLGITELKNIGTTVEEVLKFAEGKSKINQSVEREGIVVRCIKGGKKVFSFKAVSNKFLLKNE